eukprot:scaffold5202_cov110-Isochrysis_galbana.AAC.8
MEGDGRRGEAEHVRIVGALVEHLRTHAEPTRVAVVVLGPHEPPEVETFLSILLEQERVEVGQVVVIPLAAGLVRSRRESRTRRGRCLIA